MVCVKLHSPGRKKGCPAMTIPSLVITQAEQSDLILSDAHSSIPSLWFWAMSRSSALWDTGGQEAPMDIPAVGICHSPALIDLAAVHSGHGEKWSACLFSSTVTKQAAASIIPSAYFKSRTDTSAGTRGKGRGWAEKTVCAKATHNSI